MGSWYKAPTPGEYNKEANYRAFKAGNTTFGGKTQTQNPTSTTRCWRRRRATRRSRRPPTTPW